MNNEELPNPPTDLHGWIDWVTRYYGEWTANQPNEQRFHRYGVRIELPESVQPLTGGNTALEEILERTNEMANDRTATGLFEADRTVHVQDATGLLVGTPTVSGAVFADNLNPRRNRFYNWNAGVTQVTETQMPPVWDVGITQVQIPLDAQQPTPEETAEQTLKDQLKKLVDARLELTLCHDRMRTLVRARRLSRIKEELREEMRKSQTLMTRIERETESLWQLVEGLTPEVAAE